jgi:hypothetical protein
MALALRERRLAAAAQFAEETRGGRVLRVDGHVERRPAGLVLDVQPRALDFSIDQFERLDRVRSFFLTAPRASRRRASPSVRDRCMN